MVRPQLRLGTRRSALAQWQAQWVASQLIAAGIEVELVPITTRGDASQRDSLAAPGSPGLFTKELERALLDEQIDLAVHSLKDLPTEPTAGLVVAAVPERESPRDVLVSRHGPLDRLPERAVVGTGSPRRRAQLLHLRGDLQMSDIRGNVDTRLEKLAAGSYDALVLAEAGLRRLGLQGRITQVFEGEALLPAPGQGALAIQSRAGDDLARTLIAPLDHAASHCAVDTERLLLAALGGGCLAPIGAWARPQKEGQMRLDAVVLSVDGRQRLAASGSSEVAAASKLAADVASQLIAAGADALLAWQGRPEKQ